jgi:cysteine desulfurase
MDLIYFDNAATTLIYPEVIEAMHDTLQGDFGNPSSVHAAGRSEPTTHPP